RSIGYVIDRDEIRNGRRRRSSRWRFAWGTRGWCGNLTSRRLVGTIKEALRGLDCIMQPAVIFHRIANRPNEPEIEYKSGDLIRKRHPQFLKRVRYIARHRIEKLEIVLAHFGKKIAHRLSRRFVGFLEGLDRVVRV